MAQLADRSLPASEISGSNPLIGQLYLPVLKGEKSRKRGGERCILKKFDMKRFSYLNKKIKHERLSDNF